MRFVNPYPFGHAPQNADLSGTLDATTKVALLDSSGARAGEASGATLQQLRELLTIREGNEPFDQQFVERWGLELWGGQGLLGRFDVAADGSGYWITWNGWAALAHPAELFAWLAAAGLRGPLEAWNGAQGLDAEEVLTAWRDAIPLPFRSSWNRQHEQLVTADFDAAGRQRELIEALGSRAAAISALLDWYGAGQGPLRLRPAYESLPRILLATVGFDPVIAVIPTLEASRPLAGAARFVLDATPLAPTLAAPVLALPEEARERLVAAATDAVGPDDAARLRGELFPAPYACPAGATHVGTSISRQLRRLVAGRAGAFAIDGFDLAHFAEGQRTVLQPLPREIPMAAHGGSLWLATGAMVRELDSSGRLLKEHPGAETAERESRQAELARHAPPPRAGLEAVSVGVAEQEAYAAFGHLGLPLPAAARLATSHYVDFQAHEVVRPGASPERIPLSGRPLLAAAVAPGIVVAIEQDERLVLVWLDEAGTAIPGAPLAIAPATLCGLAATAEHAVLTLDTGRSQMVAKIMRPAP